MDDMRNWRRYHAEVDALAQVGDSDKDFSPQSSETAEGNATENCNAKNDQNTTRFKMKLRDQCTFSP
jgi:hypothetical protein